MTKVDGTEESRAAGLHEALSTNVIALVSRNAAFSEGLCRATVTELDNAFMARFDAVDDIVDSLPNWRSRLRLVVVDELAAGQMDINLVNWLRTQSGAAFACAYKDGEKARALMARGAYPDGVSSFFSFNLSFDSWVSMLRLCMTGISYVTPEILHPATHAVLPRDAEAAKPACQAPQADTIGERDIRTHLDRLTTRERQILELVAKGYQNKVIATLLELSENTVKQHIHHIISKFGVHNRTEAAMIYANARH